MRGSNSKNYILQVTIDTALDNFQGQMQEKVNRIKTLQAQTTHELDGILPSVLDKIFQKP